MDDWDEALGVLLVMYAPALCGGAAFVLICLAAWPRPPMPLRILCGTLGGGLLLWSLWYFILRGLLNQI